MALSWFKRKDNTYNLAGLPSNVIKLNGQREQGPNCWNATMVYFNENEPIRYVSEEEMRQWLNTNTLIDEYKLSAVGSILVLYNEEELIHTAVYVSPGILWHKRGCGGHWEFVTEKQLKNIYFEATKREHRILKP